MSRRGGNTNTYALTSTHLTHEWVAANNTGRREYPLAQLAAEVSIVAGRGAPPEGAIQRGLFFAGLAAAVWFSTFRSAVPFLPYLFAAVAVYDVRRHFAAAVLVEYTVVSKNNGEVALWIDRKACAADALAEFERALAANVRAVKQLSPPNG